MSKIIHIDLIKRVGIPELGDKLITLVAGENEEGYNGISTLATPESLMVYLDELKEQVVLARGLANLHGFDGDYEPSVKSTSYMGYNLYRVSENKPYGSCSICGITTGWKVRKDDELKPTHICSDECLEAITEKIMRERLDVVSFPNFFSHTDCPTPTEFNGYLLEYLGNGPYTCDFCQIDKAYHRLGECYLCSPTCLYRTILEGLEGHLVRPDRSPIMHTVKSDFEVYKDVADGAKTFEIRVYDRDYRVGDTLKMTQTAKGDRNTLTGAFTQGTIDYILYGGKYGLQLGYVGLGLDNITSSPMPNALTESNI